MKISNLFLTSILGCVSCLSGAAATLYSTGFESPTVSTGTLAGQDGWSAYGTSTVATVETSIVDSGFQAVGLSGSVATQSGVYHSNPTSSSIVDISADIYLATGAAASGWQFAVTGNGLTPLAGGIDITTLGRINLITPGYGDVGAFTRNTWHEVDFAFNYTTQTYSFALDGVTLASNVKFCGDSGPCTSNGLVSGYVDSFFDTFGNGSDAGYLDNFSVSTPATTTSSTPEPASLLLMGMGLAAAGIVRSRRAH